MHLTEIARFAKIKGLTMVGTGDFTHPKWLKEMRQTFLSEPTGGLYRLPDRSESSIYFMLTSEVSTVFRFGNEVKKVHNVVLTPSIETAVQVNDILEKYGNLELDGRPTLRMSAPHLVEEVMQVSRENMVIPAHIWTPWFSVFGAFSGFDNIEDCYQDMTKHIHALETGLSSDPPMNWRLTKLDSYTLVSNSDSHSFWPWRIGREANVFDLKDVTYSEVLTAIKSKDRSRFKFTIETDPAYGKYHWTGHRKCNVCFSSREAKKFGNICPVCRRKLTKGVEQRVDELADRRTCSKPVDAHGFKRLIPLSEIIAVALNASSPSTKTVWKIYNSLIDKFGDEYTVLIEAPKNELNKIVEPPISDAICRVRTGSAKVAPGYDGLYGKLLLDAESSTDFFSKRVQQSSLSDFY